METDNYKKSLVLLHNKGLLKLIANSVLKKKQQQGILM
jgi:hypothetical protein